VGSVVVEVSLQIEDGAKPVVPDCFVIGNRLWESFAEEILRMDADDQHLLVTGTVEDAYPPAFRQIAGRAPEKVGAAIPWRSAVRS